MLPFDASPSHSKHVTSHGRDDAASRHPPRTSMPHTIPAEGRKAHQAEHTTRSHAMLPHWTSPFSSRQDYFPHAITLYKTSTVLPCIYNFLIGHKRLSITILTTDLTNICFYAATYEGVWTNSWRWRIAQCITRHSIL